jgi:hypothetical protein
VLDQLGIAVIGEAAGELAEDAGDLLDLSEQQGAAIGGDVAAVEGGEDLSGPQGREVEVGRVLCREVEEGVWPGPTGPPTCGNRSRSGITLCGHRVSFRGAVDLCDTIIYVPKGTRSESFGEKCGLAPKQA